MFLRKKNGYSEIANRMQTMEQNLVAEIKQLSVSSEISQLRTDFLARIQGIERSLLREFQQSRVPLDQLQKQVNDLLSLVSQVSSVSPSGTQKPVHERIKARIQAINDAVGVLAQDQTEWFDEHLNLLQETQRSLRSTQERLDASVEHVAPVQEKDAAD